MFYVGQNVSAIHMPNDMTSTDGKLPLQEIRFLVWDTYVQSVRKRSTRFKMIVD
jgi:hypothetical protein